MRITAPFPYLADTAWELFHRLDRDEADHYLRTRADQGFTVVKAVAVAEMDGLREPSVYGDMPFEDHDPGKPGERYWQHVDYVMDRARALGLTVALLPTWGNYQAPFPHEEPPLLDPGNAAGYGRFIGARYGRSAIPPIWVLGGDRAPVQPHADYRPTVRALAAGLDEGAGGHLLTTYHPPGGTSSTRWLIGEPWLDLHMWQSGHGAGHDVPVWEFAARDLALDPALPTLDGEPNYEDHPVNPWPTWDPALGRFDDYDVRKQLYRAALSGTAGITYGHHAVWQFYSPAREPINHPDRPWTEALHRPGAEQIRHLRAVLEQHEDARAVPAQDLLAGDAEVADADRIVVSRARDGHAVLAYSSSAQPFTLDLKDLQDPIEVRAQWLDTRTGQATAATPAFTGPARNRTRWTPPPGDDALLVARW